MSVFHCPEITGKTLQGEQRTPVTAETAAATSVTSSSPQVQCEPWFFVSLENQTNGLFLYMFIPQLVEICTQFPGICRVHKEQATERFPGSQLPPCQHGTQAPCLLGLEYSHLKA